MRVRVGGVMEERGGQDDNTIYLALEDVEELNTWVSSQRPDRRRDGYNNAIIIVDESEQALEVEGTLLDMGFYAFSARTIIQQVSVFFVIIQAVFGGIGAIALLVAAIGITNTMIMSIMERTREIGLMKAVGATNRDVMSIFLTEAGLIGVMGGIGGVVFGAVVSKIIDLIAIAYINAQTAASGATPEESITIVLIPLWLPIFAVLFSLVIGLGSGIYPALRAVQLDPVTALKYE
jgi:putative ABC transport system permease protein